MSPSDYLPTASIETLRLRSRLLAWTRSYFQDHGYCEVQTPLISQDVCVDAWLDPFTVTGAPTEEKAAPPRFLQTSPEFGMKRLLAAGADSIVQIGPAFRHREIGLRHNPEFTMIEWYRVGDTYRDQMDFTESFVARFLEQARILSDASSDELQLPFKRLLYDDAFEEVFGTRVLHLSAAEISDVAAQHDFRAPDWLNQGDVDGWLNLLLEELVEPSLERHRAVFLHDYPATQAALARIRHDALPVAERFELYLAGIEICNGYQELTNADEYRQRIVQQSKRRATEGLPQLPTESRLLQAMDAGLPECSGVALGFDRLLMVALGKAGIDEVIAFPWTRA